MSSPALTPRPRRSLAGPVVLIILGVVFLLGTMGVLRWQHLGYLFARFWPVLLIVWGIIKLLEYQRAQREGTRPAGIGAGGILLLVILIVMGLSATQASHVNWGALRDQVDIDDSDFNWFGNTYDYTDTLAKDFPPGASLKVVDDHGGVNVTVSNDAKINVSVRKKIGAENQETANKYNESTKPQITVSGNVVTLNANTGAAGDHSVAVDLDVSIPRKAALSISSRRGDVNVTGRDGNLNISNQHGDIALSDVNGDASLQLDHSSLHADNIAGDVSIDGRANEVALNDIKGAAHLSGEFMESVKLSRIGKAVTFKSSRTDMEFTKLDGDLDLDSGDLRASRVAGPVRVTTRSKDIRLEDVSGEVRVTDENGSVELQMASLGNVQIENRKGDVQVTVPVKAGFQVDARARDGEIQSEFDEINIDTKHDWTTATGTVGNGGPKVLITNEHGSVELRKGSSVAEAPEAPSAPSGPKAPHIKAKPVQPTEN